MLNRRHFCTTTALACGAAALGSSHLVQAANAMIKSGATLIEVAQSPWLCNAVGITQAGRVFLGLPRWPGYENSPSIVEVMHDGSLKPFPGNSWNAWAPGKPVAEAMVKINTIHIFDDDTLWAIDQGDDAGPHGINPGQKILQFDTRTGHLLRSITLAPEVLPAGANLNDLRLDSEHAYLTDSGLGAIIVVNLKTGLSIRRLAGHPATQMDPGRKVIGEDGQPFLMSDGSLHLVHSDPIEISPDGEWLYFQPLAGPLWRVPTQALRDTQLSDKAVGDKVEFVYDTPALTGTAIDSAGNIYMGEYEKPRVSVLRPDGSVQVIVEDERLYNPDAMVVTAQRELYIPVPQSARQSNNRGPGGTSTVKGPYRIYKVKLPADLGANETVPTSTGKPLMNAT
ncbi:L-dopachrome tautomerase-related protein [Pseudomonas sp. dw_358]|uniref:L-dopachrome tautomerase-related protein n=1 Tax=Pseudomonas sp. dw_358 TaxID=2720083 RepID=UPI001BD526A7|nr:L-dopachrome tautomerase-related protein [Pseudomonas sp. dw_358]